MRASGLGWSLAAGALVVAVCLAVFAPTFSAGLVNWDDETGIARNQGFRGLDAEHLGWMFTTSTLGHFQPLSWLSLAVDQRLFGLSSGLEPPEAGRFHRTSVVLHVLTALVFLALATRVLARALPDVGPRARLAGATFAALLFAAHPLRAESVAWLTERRDVLSGLFFVAAILCWWRSAERDPTPPEGAPALGAALAAVVAAGAAFLALDLSGATLALSEHGVPWLALSLVALAVSTVLASHGRSSREQLAFGAAVLLALLSLLSKAWGIVLPAVLLVADAWPLRRDEHARFAERWTGLVAEKAPLFALTAVFARLAAWAQGSLPGTMVGLEEHSLLERVTQGLYGLAWYPQKTLWPSELTPYVELPAELSLGTPRFGLAAAAVAVAFLAALLLRRRAPALLAALVAFAVIVSPVLGVAQSGPQLVADRYSYLSGLPLALLLGGALTLVARSSRAFGSVALVLGSAWIAALGVAGFRQAGVWRDSQSLWEHALEVGESRNGFAATKLAQVRLAEAVRATDPAEKRRAFESAWKLLEEQPREDDPVWLSTFSEAHRRRPEILADPARAQLLARAVELGQRAVALQGDAVHPEMRLNLATALIESGQAARAVPELEAFTRARPEDALGWINLGVALAAAGRAPAALIPLQRGLALDPGYTKGWRFLALAREEMGDRAGALAAWRKVLEGWPRHGEARARVQALEGL